jgi:Mg2+-importing ATPase
VVLAIRTRRRPFFRSRPSVPMVLAVGGVVLVGAVLPATPFAADLGFHPLPGGFFAALVGMVVLYLVLVELGKGWFYGRAAPAPVPAPYPRHRAVRRRAARFSSTRHGRRQEPAYDERRASSQGSSSSGGSAGASAQP